MGSRSQHVHSPVVPTMATRPCSSMRPVGAEGLEPLTPSMSGRTGRSCDLRLSASCQRRTGFDLGLVLGVCGCFGVSRAPDAPRGPLPCCRSPDGFSGGVPRAPLVSRLTSGVGVAALLVRLQSGHLSSSIVPDIPAEPVSDEGVGSHSLTTGAVHPSRLRRY
jgi:hypothetical protein